MGPMGPETILPCIALPLRVMVLESCEVSMVNPTCGLKKVDFIGHTLNLKVWYKQCKSRRCLEVKLSPRDVSKDTLTTP